MNWRENTEPFQGKEIVSVSWGKVEYLIVKIGKIGESPLGTARLFEKLKRSLRRGLLDIFDWIRFQFSSAFQYLLSFEGLKDPLLERTKTFLAIDHFSLVSGMVLGDISSMSEEFRQKLKIIGMSHVVSASGYNVSFLLHVSGFLFRRFFSRKTWFILCLLEIYLYAFITGWQPSIIRAVLMSSLGLFASLVVARQYRPLRGLMFACACMLSADFRYLENISFQFSVLATLGIIVFLSRGKIHNNTTFELLYGDIFISSMESTLKPFKSAVFEMFRDSILVTLAAQAFVLPLAVLYFHEISLIGLAANAALLWLTPIITGIGFAMIMGSLVFYGFLGRVFLFLCSFCAFVSINVLNFSVDFFAGFSWGFISLNEKISREIALFWYLSVFFILVLKYQANRRKPELL